MIYGIDVHPVFQHGLSVEQVAREGFDWLEVKVTQGAHYTTASAGSASWMERAERAGMIAVPYHYLEAGDPDGQAANFHAQSGGRPGMVDVEQGSGTVAGDLRPFLAACARVGQTVALCYLPRWYWQQIGSPSLAGLPPIVASHYDTVQGSEWSQAATVPAAWWADYGGGHVAVLQNTDHAQVAGMSVDANMYAGTREEFAALLGRGPAVQAAQPASLPNLRIGDTSALVWQLQTFLVRVFPSYARIDAGPGPTSRFGPQTAAAVQEFQRRCAIPAGGVPEVGPRTWAALQSYGFRVA